MHHVTSLVQSMAFNSLNTIDKDCVTVASSGRKKSGAPLTPWNGGRPKP